MAQRARGAAAGARPAAGSRSSGRPLTDRGGRGRSGPDMAGLRARLRSIVEPLVTAAGLDLDDLTVVRVGRRHVVRVTVDGDSGIGHDELSEVSRDISAGLDAAEATGDQFTEDSYTLEVSSPGIDRPLTLTRHWRRNIGRLVKVRAGDRSLTARITAVDDVGVTLDAAGRSMVVPFGELGPGRVQVEFRGEDDGGDIDGDGIDGDGIDGDGTDGDGQTEQEDGA